MLKVCLSWYRKDVFGVEQYTNDEKIDATVQDARRAAAFFVKRHDPADQLFIYCDGNAFSFWFTYDGTVYFSSRARGGDFTDAVVYPESGIVPFVVAAAKGCTN